MPISLILLVLQGGAGVPFELAWPIDCRAGESCFVQNYYDHDAGPGRRDYACGSMSYDGHAGTDVRLPDLARMRAGVAVRAAAAGTVRGVRDGVADVSVRGSGAAAVKGRECGNGVLIEHGGGWQTQYCHMKRGSIAVRPAAGVTAGAKLGEVGLSGQTEFPHLHLSVRKDGREVDPFAYGAAPGKCRSGRMLWSASARAALAYRSPSVIATGFAAGAVTDAAIEAGSATTPLTVGSPAIVAFVRAIGLEAGDVQELRLIGPSGQVLKQQRAAALDRPKATYFLFTGSNVQAGRWPPGTYAAEYRVVRRGAAALQRRWSVKLDR